MLASLWSVASSDFKCWACYQREGSRFHLDSLAKCTERGKRPGNDSVPRPILPRPAGTQRGEPPAPPQLAPPVPVPAQPREETDGPTLAHLPSFYELQAVEACGDDVTEICDSVDADYFRLVEETKGKLGSSCRRELKHVRHDLSVSEKKQVVSRQACLDASTTLSRSLETLDFNASKGQARTETEPRKVEAVDSVVAGNASIAPEAPMDINLLPSDISPAPAAGAADATGQASQGRTSLASLDSQPARPRAVSVMSADADDDKERPEEEDGAKIDRQYVELGIPDRLARIRQGLKDDGDTLPDPSAYDAKVRRKDQARQDSRRMSAEQDLKHHVESYQDLMRNKFRSIGAQNMEQDRPRKTVDPSIAVVDGVMRYHNHCVQLGEFYAMPGDKSSSDGIVQEQHDAYLTLSTCEGDGANRFWPKKT